MRWERLFEDLEAQLEAAENEELAAEVADRSRREVARLRLVDRLRGSVGATTILSLQGLRVRGTIGRVGPDWVLLDDAGADFLVPLAAVVLVEGLGPGSAEPGSEGEVTARLGLAYALRAIAGDRAEVRVFLADGSQRTGRIGRVGADHLELVEHDPGEPSLVRGTATVPFQGLTAVRALSVRTEAGPSSSRVSGWVLTNSAVSAYIRWM